VERERERERREIERERERWRKREREKRREEKIERVLRCLSYIETVGGSSDERVAAFGWRHILEERKTRRKRERKKERKKDPCEGIKGKVTNRMLATSS
jgi:hypothetical protein